MQSLLDTLLAPLARLSIARGQRFADLAEQLRRGFFREAQNAAGSGATDSKLSVMTGLQRRDIVRLRAEGQAAVPQANPQANPLARLVAIWSGDPRYAGRDLPRRGPVSFDALAAEISKDMHPRTFLDQLEAAGTLKVTGDRVVLQAKAFRPLRGSDDQLAYLALNVGDHLAASVSNVLHGSGHLDQAVHYNHLSPEAVAELEVIWRAAVTDAMQDINARAVALQATHPGTTRFRAGAYFWQDEETV